MNLFWIHLSLGCVLGLWVLFTVLNPRLWYSTPSHAQTHSLLELSLSLLDIQLTFTFSGFWKLPLRQMQIQYYACQSAEQKRDFLLHLPSLELLVLFFPSLLNSKWGDCCCSDEHEGICITELAVSSSTEILYNFLISKGIALISFDDVSQLIF